MKTYEITATLHDGRVVYENQIEAVTVLYAIESFIKLHPRQSNEFQTLNVKEITPKENV